MTAKIRCSCKNDAHLSWSTQNYVPGTEIRTGNLAIAAAAQTAPVSYPDLASLFNAAGIPIMQKWSFIQLSKHYVWPTIEDAYYMQKADLITTLAEPASISLDGQYDSPGYSAEFCAVTAIESETKQVLTFSITHKSEVGNVSGRMEIEGVKKCLQGKKRCL